MPKEAIISSSRLNCYGTRVLTEGVDLEQYRKNPILLYMHRRGSRDDMPIGVIENLRVEGDFIYGTPKIDSDTDEEKIIAQKWERGTLRMLSAGVEIIELSDDPQYLVQGQTRPTVIRSKLVEVSVVDIGANEDALQTVKLYSDNKLLTLAKGEENALLPLLKTSDPQADDAAGEHSQTQNQFSMNKILQLLGLAANATEDDAVAAITLMKQENDTLRLARITDAVDSAVSDKRITEDKKEHFLALGKSAGLDTLRQTLSMFAPATKPMELIHTGGSGKLELKWEECSSEQLETLRKDNRDEYIRLYKAHFGFAPTFN